MIHQDKKKIEEEVEMEDIEESVDDLEFVVEEKKATDKIKLLRTKLKRVESEKMQSLEDLQRVKADFLNSKRRLKEQSLLDVERATIKCIHSILPLADSFDMAMNDSKAWNSCDENWRTGVEAIYTQLMNILKNYNVTEINEIKVSFDPELHEAISNFKADSKNKPNTVTEIVQKGYRMDETIIRPARVIVAT